MWLLLIQDTPSLPVPADSGDLLSGITAATVLGLIVALVRIAVGQADKRATVAEKREEVCTTMLTTTIGTIGALTAEMKQQTVDGNAYRARREAQVAALHRDLSERWDDLERAVTELLDHARRER